MTLMSMLIGDFDTDVDADNVDVEVNVDFDDDVDVELDVDVDVNVNVDVDIDVKLDVDVDIDVGVDVDADVGVSGEVVEKEHRRDLSDPHHHVLSQRAADVQVREKQISSPQCAFFESSRCSARLRI